jgi:outer membrane protein OmpA-like peptidoglycan-associated protein
MLAIVAFGSVALPLTSGCAAKQKVVAIEVPVPPPPPPPVPLPALAAPPPRIVLPGELEFENNSPYIKQTRENLELLGQLVDILQRNPRITKLRIEGHTDNIGTAKHNQWLSEARAESVARWLGKHDIDPSRIVTVGFGDVHPLVDNSTLEHRRMNRRTEFHVQELNGERSEEDDAKSTSATDKE